MRWANIHQRKHMTSYFLSSSWCDCSGKLSHWVHSIIKCEGNLRKYFQFGPILKKRRTKSLTFDFLLFRGTVICFIFWGWDQIENNSWDYLTFNLVAKNCNVFNLLIAKIYFVDGKETGCLLFKERCINAIFSANWCQFCNLIHTHVHTFGWNLCWGRNFIQKSWRFLVSTV